MEAVESSALRADYSADTNATRVFGLAANPPALAFIFAALPPV
jgi:hypothetical protein